MALDAETLRAVAEAFEADMADHDYCCGSEKGVRLLLKQLGAPIASCDKCGAKPMASSAFCEYCDPNRPVHRADPNAGQKMAEAWATALTGKMEQPYYASYWSSWGK